MPPYPEEQSREEKMYLQFCKKSFAQGIFVTGKAGQVDFVAGLVIAKLVL